AVRRSHRPRAERDLRAYRLPSRAGHGRYRVRPSSVTDPGGGARGFGAPVLTIPAALLSWRLRPKPAPKVDNNEKPFRARRPHRAPDRIRGGGASAAGARSWDGQGEGR